MIEWCKVCENEDKVSNYACCTTTSGKETKPSSWVPKKSAIKDSGDRTLFDTGAVRDLHEGKGRCDLLPAVAILRLARHFENGCNKYGDRNWEKGIPIHCYIDSAMRHLLKYLDGQTDEDHLCAAAWNCMCAMWTEEKKPELQDIPSRIVK